MYCIKRVYLGIVLVGTMVVMYGCNKAELYNPNYYTINSPYYLNIPNVAVNFVVCEDLFASKTTVEYKANLACSTIKKQAKLIKKSYFSTCFLLYPIANEYQCV